MTMLTTTATNNAHSAVSTSSLVTIRLISAMVFAGASTLPSLKAD